MVQDRVGLVNIIVHGVSLALQAVLTLFIRLALSCSVSLVVLCALSLIP